MFLVGRRASASVVTTTNPSTDGSAAQWAIDGLPTADEVPDFDLEQNWGSTPQDLRPLFALLEIASGIQGSGRVFACIAIRESKFVTTAHNDDKSEVDASRAGYENRKAVNPPLRFGDEAANFGSGGLFAALAPYFLWTGVPEVGKKAPLLNAHPEAMFVPRIAGFAATVYLQRLLHAYRVDDIPDVKAGWASPTLLGKGRGSTTYNKVRADLASDVAQLGIDLAQIPKLSATNWPGVIPVYQRLVGVAFP